MEKLHYTINRANVSDSVDVIYLDRRGYENTLRVSVDCQGNFEQRLNPDALHFSLAKPGRGGTFDLSYQYCHQGFVYRYGVGKFKAALLEKSISYNLWEEDYQTLAVALKQALTEAIKYYLEVR